MINSFKLQIKVTNNKVTKHHNINYDVKSLPNEVWKSLLGYEGFYEVSNFGRIKHLSFNSINKRDSFANKTFILSTKLSKGYRQVCLIDKYGNKQLKYVHKLVALTFIPNPNNYSFVNHKDENKENNNVSNLEWCDSYYNNTYNNRHIKVGEKIRKYVKLIKIKDNEEEFINVFKLSDIRLYHISYKTLYKYIDTDKKFYSKVNNCYYKIVSL